MHSLRSIKRKEKMKTLIIVDVQNDFLPGGSLEVPKGDVILPVINRIQPEFDLIVATQDWHPLQHKSFASQHEGKKPFENITLNGMEQTLWPDHCVQGSWGAEFPPGLKTERVEAIFRKGVDPEIDSYSAFYDNGHKRTTGLAGYLRDKGAGELFFCGLAADICVYYTISDALKEGFNCSLVENATYPLYPEQFKNIRAELVDAEVRIHRG